MIIAALYGGLGNQVFQYAAARAAALRSRQDLALDLSWFTSENTNRQQRRYLLNKFQIQAFIATERDLARIKLGHNSDDDFHDQSVRKPEIIREGSFEFQGELRSDECEAYIDGYWQSEKYFLEFSTQIRSELTICEDTSAENRPVITPNQSQPSVAIHVRRGDFASDPQIHAAHGLCSMDYYYKAAALLVERLGSPRFFVFSDDPDWCKSNLFLRSDTRYIGNSDINDPTMDFRLMTQCEHFVNANSSFSWWASWLAMNPNKIVTAPKKLVISDQVNTKDYFPLRWVHL